MCAHRNLRAAEPAVRSGCGVQSQTTRGDLLRKRPLSPGYIFFYILFLPDTWQIIIGIIAASLLSPTLRPADMGTAGGVVLFVMVAAIGYAATGRIARGFTRWLKKWILGDRQP
jgi:hypothetical protein